jgi:hypothetical protein
MIDFPIILFLLSVVFFAAVISLPFIGMKILAVLRSIDATLKQRR